MQPGSARYRFRSSFWRSKSRGLLHIPAGASRQTAPSVAAGEIGEELYRLGALFEGLVAVLKRKKIISTDDLAAAINKRARA